MKRGLGYVHKEAGLLVKAASGLRSRKVGDSFEPQVHPEWPILWGGALDQGPTSSCTGFWWARAAELTVKAVHGVDIKFSPLASYYWGRARTAPTDRYGYPIMEDGGCYTGDVVWAGNKIGLPPDSSWPSRNAWPHLLEERVNVRPTLLSVTASKSAAKLYPVQGTQIVATGDRLVQRILHSLDLGQYVGVAIPVSEDFMNGVGVIAQKGNDYGYHQVGIGDWAKIGTRYFFLVMNSWGNEWGSFPALDTLSQMLPTAPRGCRWATAEWVGDQSIATFYVTG